MDPDTPAAPKGPSLLAWTLGFLIVGMAWGFTTPFMRKAALNYTPTKRPILESQSTGRIAKFILTAVFAVYDTLRRPAYAIPFLINVTGSIWFFLLIGQAGKHFKFLVNANSSATELTIDCNRTKFDGTDYQLSCVSLHSPRRVVG